MIEDGSRTTYFRSAFHFTWVVDISVGDPQSIEVDLFVSIATPVSRNSGWWMELFHDREISLSLMKLPKKEKRVKPQIINEDDFL